ncbi:MAG: AraC family transcriptional regulator [Bacteroidales bacterium]|nr:AraC family transcriptional regulator [Bacteroidales bacterium]
MQALLIGLILFSLLSTATGIVLYIKLRKLKESKANAGSTDRLSMADAPSASYEMTAIDQLLYDRCCRYMTERRPYLVDSFSLQDLANAVYTNKGTLSRTINRFSGRNFRKYVNYYRVMYAMDLFRKNMGLRISDLAHLSGFHSVSSFHDSFKEVMGESPSHWCASMRRKQSSNLNN